MTMPHVVFLNGPPRSGKDTAGQILADIHPNAYTIKLAGALKVGTHALFRALHWDLDEAKVANVMQPDALEHVKEVPMPWFFDKTPREAYIAVSELLCKPLFGQEFFGNIVADQIRRHSEVGLWIITDSGFEPEARPIIHQVGKDNCTLVRLHRDGCTFAGDSRSYIDLDVANKFDLKNNGTLGDLAYLLRTAVLGSAL